MNYVFTHFLSVLLSFLYLSNALEITTPAFKLRIHALFEVKIRNLSHRMATDTNTRSTNFE